jgi:hypothetical protein
VESGTLATVAGTVSKATATAATLNFATATEISVIAGEKKTLSFSVGPVSNAYPYTPTLGFKDPIIYLREMPGITIDETSIKVIKG